jgi:hypothetical protein
MPPTNTCFSPKKLSLMHTLLVLVFPIMAVQLFSCVRDSPCPDPPETIVVNLPDNLKNNIPYKGFDTLTFIRKTDGDTHMFIGQGVKRGYDLLRRNGGDEECRSSTGTARMEFISYTFASTTFSSPIYVEMYYVDYPVGTYIKIRFNNKTYDAPTTVFTPFSKDSFLVAGRMHYDVARIADDANPLSQKYFTLYNATSGILKIRFENGEEWELLTKP